MNSAPAELLHHLIHAALQPHLVAPLFCYSSSRVDDEGGRQAMRSSGAVAVAAKKNAGSNAGVGILFRKNRQVFQSKSRLARLRRDMGAKQR